MRWTVFAIACIALTVALAAWVGRPSPLEIGVPDPGDVEDLNITRIRNHIEELASTPSRVTGYGGAAQAADYIREELHKLGVTEQMVQDFDVAIPYDEGATLTAQTRNGVVSFEVYPLWPNLARTPQTPPEGLRAPIVDLGGGEDDDLEGNPISDHFVVIDSNSESQWLHIQEFSPTAVLFRANANSSGSQFLTKFLTVPADTPRYYVPHEHLGTLDRVLSDPGADVVIKCEMDWRKVTAKNIFAKLSDGNPEPGAPEYDKTPVIFHAYYDSISVVPGLSPGAEQAVGASTLLEVARFIRSLEEKPGRPVYLLFTGGHGQALAGMTHFTRVLHEGLTRGWAPDQEDSLVARMGEPGVMVGLDLSSRSERMGVFCVGRFRRQHEHILRPKFSDLGMSLDKYAKEYMTNHWEKTTDEITPAMVTPFVDCINLTLGRGWWTYFPYQAPFESEIPVMAAFPAVTLSTINDDRRYVDTPEDTVEHVDYRMLERQLTFREGERVGLGRLALAFAYWKGPFVGSELEPKISKVKGHVKWLDQMRDYTPNRPLRNAVVILKTFRGDKYMKGTRGVPVDLADENGAFEFDGLIDMTANAEFNVVELEAYGLATERFMEANPTAKEEYLSVLKAGGASGDDVVLDGRIIYGVDHARPDEQPFRANMISRVQNLSLVTFPCEVITLYGLTEPRGFVSLTDMQILDVATESPPFQWGTSYIDSGWGDPEENCMSVWADPTLQVRLTLGFGMKEKRLILINNSAEDPVGVGYKLSELDTIPSWVLQGAMNMWHLDEERLTKFERHGVTNPRVRELHEEALVNLERAQEAFENNDYMTYRMAAERGWALESGAYNELLAMANNMIKGVLFYLLLLLPFAYCMERLVLASGTVKGRIMGMAAIFVLSFALLALIHPAFKFTLTPLLVLLAFVILSLAATVSALILSKFDGMLQERKHAATGLHEDTVAVSNVAVRAVDLGIANIRRRHQRAFFTGLTIVLVTFTLLSFTSLVPEVGISRLRHREGEPVYKGMLARDRSWNPMPNPLYKSLRRNFVEGEVAAEGNVVAGRAWYFSDHAGNLSQIDVSAVNPERLEGFEGGDTGVSQTFVAVSLMGFEPQEIEVTAVEDTLTAGRWIKEPDEISAILPAHLAKNLGFTEADLGEKIRLFGREVPVVGFYDAEKFDALRDLDGEAITPVNFAQQALLEAQQSEAEQVDTLKEYVHYGSDQTLIVPFKFCQQMGGSLRSVAVRTGDETSPHTQAQAYARRSNLTMLASDGEAVTLYASVNRSKLTGAGQILIPLLLGFIMVLGTMMGSVYERRSEIFVYNSVGLSPTNVASLFLAESAVYAVIGACSGYLLGQVISKVLMMSDRLSGVSLNYSAGTTIFVTILTMGIVLLSTIYPARQAFMAAIPEKRGREDELEDDGEGGTDTISLYLPFVATEGSVCAMQAYTYEYLDSVQGVSVGQLAVDDLRTGVEDVNGRPAPTLYFRAWLAPFDLGISHDAVLKIVYRDDRGVYQYHLTATRNSGDEQNWRRLTPRFLLTIRKQLLMWRILSTEETDKYRETAKELFDQNTI